MKSELVLARFISLVFHPMLIPTIGTYLLFSLQSYITYKITGQQKLNLYLLVLINTFIFPTLLTLIMIRLGWVQSFQLRSAKERRLPYLITVIFYFITYYLLRNAQLPNVYLVMLLGATLSVLLSLIINLVWKISAHLVGMGGLAGAIMGLSFRLDMNLIIPLAVVFILSGIVAYARLRLNTHTSFQVYGGFFLGFFCEFLLILIT